MMAVLFWPFVTAPAFQYTVASYAVASVSVEPVQRAVVETLPRLKIPVINVDAKIDSMGVTKDGAMESPSGAQDVGWFAFGPRPGENGSAVLAGHYGRWKNGDVSVFDNLHTLQPGDKLYVQDKDGVTITFIVRQLRTYDKNDDTSQVFISDDGVSHLNIIACAGVYDETLKTYSSRLVVFADKQ